MRNLLTILAVVLMASTVNAQVFENKKSGQTVDIAVDFEDGQLLSYKVVQQGIFVTKTLSADFANT